MRPEPIKQLTFDRGFGIALNAIADKSKAIVFVASGLALKSETFLI